MDLLPLNINTMKLGISTASFFSKYKNEESLNIIKELELDLCEVFLTTGYEYKEEFVRSLLDIANKLNLSIYSVHALSMQFEPELFNKVDRTFNDALITFKLLANAAKILNAKYYTFHGPARLKKKTYHIDYCFLAKRLKYLNTLLAEITNKQCEIAYENVHWTFFNSPLFFQEISKLIDLKCCLDIKQAFQSQIDILDYLKVMKNSLRNVHICDFDSMGNLKLPGKGIFDFESFFKSLQEVNYKGPIILELYANNFNSLNEIKESIKYLNNCLENVGGKNERKY